MTAEFALAPAPTDGVSAVRFSPFEGSRQLLATSWDSTAYLYDCDSGQPVGQFMTGAALLDGCFSALDRTTLYAGGLGRQLHRYRAQHRARSTHGA